MTTTKEQNATFQKVGNDFGFGNVTAEYAPFRDLKVRWQRTYDWASFQVSDYLGGHRSKWSRTSPGRSWRGSAERMWTTPRGPRSG